MAKRPLYVLATMTDGIWYPQFSDYSRAVVAQEVRDTYSEERTRIISVSDDTQAACDAALATVNAMVLV